VWKALLRAYDTSFSYCHEEGELSFHCTKYWRFPETHTVNESIEDTEGSDNDDTNENTIKSQVDQAKQTKTQLQRNINKDKTNAQWYEATKLLKTRWVSGKRQYLVQWKDNSPSSWQYENDVS
jgi:hypothetical protein